MVLRECKLRRHAGVAADERLLAADLLRVSGRGIPCVRRPWLLQLRSRSCSQSVQRLNRRWMTTAFMKPSAIAATMPGNLLLAFGVDD